LHLIRNSSLRASPSGTALQMQLTNNWWCQSMSMTLEENKNARSLIQDTQILCKQRRWLMNWVSNSLSCQMNSLTQESVAVSITITEAQLRSKLFIWWIQMTKNQELDGQACYLKLVMKISNINMSISSSISTKNKTSPMSRVIMELGTQLHPEETLR
jgi:hypothetical protein